jgi:hypothetical protein
MAAKYRNKVLLYLWPMRKGLMILFSFYILMLSAMPCCDKDCCKDETGQTALASSGRTDRSDPTDRSGQKSQLPCSPFFICNSCHGFIIPDHTLALMSHPLPDSRLFPLYAEKPLANQRGTVWQPPKMS